MAILVYQKISYSYLGDSLVAAKVKSGFNFEMIHFVFGGVLFIGGMVVNAISIAENVATKPYVDKGLETEHKYTDEKAVSVTVDSHNYSDANRQKTLLEIIPKLTEIESHQAEEAHNQAIMLHAIEEMRDQPWESRKKYGK